MEQVVYSSTWYKKIYQLFCCNGTQFRVQQHNHQKYSEDTGVS